MKLYILRWNPTFSMKYDYFNSMMDYLKTEEINDFDWSIYDHEELESGDMFILAQVGTEDADGIAGFGFFNTDPYAGENWKEKDGTNRFYADMSVHCLISHDEKKGKRNAPQVENGPKPGDLIYNDDNEIEPFCAPTLEKLFPNVDWHKGHAGVLIPEDTVEPLILHLMRYTLPLKLSTDKIAFTEDNNANPLRTFFAQYINGLCPNFKQKIIDKNPLAYVNYKEGEHIDKSLIEISDKKFNSVKLSSESPEEDFVKFFVPIA